MTSAPTALKSTAGLEPVFATLSDLDKALRRFVDDKSMLLDVTICALLAGGHVLLEDVPGVGKTTYIKAVAKLLGLTMSRVQFTSDLLPSDILGVEVFDAERREFVFHRGPIFTQLLLADELNRASPRTQSALLEAMGEGHVTVDRKSYQLPQPFIVFAAQNPNDNVGTYELPESQLDRFSARVKVGYPTERREVEILQAAVRDPLAQVPANLVTPDQFAAMQATLETVHIAERVAVYAKRCIDRSRSSNRLRVGVSTRGGVTWLRMARAMALRSGRTYVTPDDLQAMALPCLAHRIVPQPGTSADAAVLELLKQVDVT